MARRRKENNTFLLALGDLITVLMIFFIYLYSISEIDPIKFMELKQYFQEKSTSDTEPVTPDVVKEIIEERQKLETVAKEIQELLEKEQLENEVTIEHKNQKY